MSPLVLPSSPLPPPKWGPAPSRGAASLLWTSSPSLGPLLLRTAEKTLTAGWQAGWAGPHLADLHIICMVQGRWTLPDEVPPTSLRPAHPLCQTCSEGVNTWPVALSPTQSRTACPFPRRPGRSTGPGFQGHPSQALSSNGPSAHNGKGLLRDLARSGNGQPHPVSLASAQSHSLSPVVSFTAGQSPKAGPQ